MTADKPLTEEELATRALYEAAKEAYTLFKERRWLNNGASRYFAVVQKLGSTLERYRIATEEKDSPDILY